MTFNEQVTSIFLSAGVATATALGNSFPLVVVLVGSLDYCGSLAFPLFLGHPVVERTIF